MAALKSILQRPLAPLWAVVCFAALWLDLVWLPLSPVTPGLDLSWCGALIHFTAQGLQYGKDVIFTYGPLAHLSAFVFTGELFTARIVWEFVSKTAFVAILIATMLRLPRAWSVIFFSFVLLFIWADPIADALHFLVITCLTGWLFLRGDERPSLNAFTGALLAVCSLIKFTYFLLALVVLALVIANYCGRRRVASAAILAGVFAASFLLGWKLANQDLTTLPAYLHLSFEIVSGYKEAMATSPPENTVIAISIAAGMLAFTQCMLIFFDRPSWNRLTIVIFFIATCFLSWNRAFVRADDHVLSFFAVAAVSLLVIWTVVECKLVTRRVGYVINALVFILCLSGIWVQKPPLVTRCFVDAFNRMHTGWAVLTNTSGIQRNLEAQLVTAKQTYALPRVRAEVGKQTVDVFGYEQGVALLNNLNYTPRPVFQSYSAYTPALIAANTSFYQSDRAPAYVLMKYQPIDNRYPTLEDAGVLRQILTSYTFVLEENEYLLWKKVSTARPPSGEALPSRTFRFNTDVGVPEAAAVWIELSFKRSVRGALRAALYKPPSVQLRVTDSTGETKSFRIIPSMTSSGFLLSPTLVDAKQLVAAAAGSQTPKVVTFTVKLAKPDRRFFRDEVTCRMTKLPPLQPPMAQSISAVNDDYGFEASVALLDRVGQIR